MYQHVIVSGLPNIIGEQRLPGNRLSCGRGTVVPCEDELRSLKSATERGVRVPRAKAGLAPVLHSHPVRMRHDNVSESAVKGLVNGEESDATNKLLKLQTVKSEQSAIILTLVSRVMAWRRQRSGLYWFGE